MNALLLLVFFIVVLVLLIPPLFRTVAKGKIFCIFIEDDGYMVTKLKRPMFNNEYVLDGDGAYDIIPENIGITLFPKGFFPAFFQTVVPCAIYRRDDPLPLSLKNPVLKEITAKEVRLALEPHFLKGLAQHAREGAEQTRWQRMAPLLTMALAGLALLLLFVLLTKIGALEQMMRLAP